MYGHGETHCVLKRDLTRSSDGDEVDVRGVEWLSDDEILIERVVWDRGDNSTLATATEDNLIFHTTTHAWRQL